MEESFWGRKIAELRTERGMTQAELAEKLNETEQTVFEWEQGIANPSPEQLRKILEFFGQADALFGMTSRTEGTPGTESGEPEEVPLVNGNAAAVQLTPAARALQIMLWITVGLAVVSLFFMFIRTDAALAIYAVVDMLFGLMYLADFIVLLCAKEWVDSMPVRVLFLCALIGGEFFSLLTDVSGILVYVELVFKIARLILTGFVFKPATKDRNRTMTGRVTYFAGSAVLFVLTLFFAFRGMPFGMLLFAYAMNLYGLFCIMRISKNRAPKTVSGNGPSAAGRSGRDTEG